VCVVGDKCVLCVYFTSIVSYIMYSGWGGRVGEYESGDSYTDAGPSLDVLHIFGVQERESHELGLIQVHHEQLVCWCQVCLLGCELLVKVAHVLAVFLEKINC
jgi:hypothetical protein